MDSSKEDVHTLEAFFKSLNERVPQAAVNTLMADDGTYIYIWGNWINNNY